MYKIHILFRNLHSVRVPSSFTLQFRLPPLKHPHFVLGGNGRRHPRGRSQSPTLDNPEIRSRKSEMHRMQRPITHMGIPHVRK